MVRGPHTAIQAIAGGKNAAIAIDKYLGGKGVLNKGNSIDIPAAEEIEVKEHLRFSMDCLNTEQRKNNFDERNNFV